MPISRRYTLPVEWIFVYPVKAAVHQPVCINIELLHGDADAVAAHPAAEQQATPIGTVAQ